MAVLVVVAVIALMTDVAHTRVAGVVAMTTAMAVTILTATVAAATMVDAIIGTTVVAITVMIMATVVELTGTRLVGKTASVAMIAVKAAVAIMIVMLTLLATSRLDLPVRRTPVAPMILVTMIGSLLGRFAIDWADDSK